MVEGVEGIDLDDVVPHDASEGTEFLFIFPHLGPVGGLCLLYPFNQLVDLLLGRVKLAVDAFIVGRKAVIVPLEGNHLLGKFLFLNVELLDQSRFAGPDVDQGSEQKHCRCNQPVHQFPEAFVLPFLFLALAALHDRIDFCHIRV